MAFSYAKRSDFSVILGILEATKMYKLFSSDGRGAGSVIKFVQPTGREPQYPSGVRGQNPGSGLGNEALTKLYLTKLHLTKLHFYVTMPARSKIMPKYLLSRLVFLPI